MPKYTYICESGHNFLAWASFDNCSKDQSCVACGGVGHRVFSADFQLITNPQFLLPANKFFLGTTSEKEMCAIMRADEREYNNRKPVGPGPTKAHLL